MISNTYEQYPWISTIESVLGSSIIEVILIIGKGEANTVFKVTTRSYSFIVRMNQSQESLSTYKKERWCLKQALNFGIPSPVVIGLGVAEFGSYMIQSFLPGTHGADWKEDHSFIWEQLGQYAAKINSLSMKGYGKT